MTFDIQTHESIARLIPFIGLFALLYCLEYLMPRRKLKLPKLYRWGNNLGLLLVNTLVLRLLFPSAAVGIALFSEQFSIGLLQHDSIESIPPWITVIASLILLDFAIWLQHLLFHRVPVLWRLHRVHHADQDIDLSTGLRFHPIEIVLSMLIKAGVILIFGISAVAVIVFEIVLNASSMFNHANVKLPPMADRILRLVIVTPDMHRVHHSIKPHETNSNFGFNLPWWDRIFSTYRAQPDEGHESMLIGLPYFRSQRDQRLDQLLRQPFSAPVKAPLDD